MQSCENPETLAWGPAAGAAVCWGVFDGVHRGHVSLLDLLGRVARARSLLSVAVVFAGHPARVLAGRQVPFLTTRAQRARLIAGQGVDAAVSVRFDGEFSRVRADAFVERILCGPFRARAIVVGPDTRFGCGGLGNEARLREMGVRLGFSVHAAPPLAAEGGPVRSTRIRDLVAHGRMQEAAQLLGHPFALEGKVVSGEGRGASLGFPTANLEASEQMLPARGVYAGSVAVDGRIWAAAVNVGVRPTFGGAGLPRAEAHLAGFSGDLSGRTLEIPLLARLRDEMRFSSADELQRQIRQDIERAVRVQS